MKVWWADVDGVGKHLFIDRTGKLSESRARLYLYQKMGYDMFDRPTIWLSFVNESSTMMLTCKAVKALASGEELVKI